MSSKVEKRSSREEKRWSRNPKAAMEAEAINPESEEQKECRVEVEDGTRVRMTEYISDYFTDEAYLTDALALGPVATNIAVTQSMQFYGGGVFYSPDECQVLNHNLFNRK